MAPQHSSCRHAVLFYKDEAAMRDRVAAYVASALREGRPALVIAGPELRRQLQIGLHRQHVQGQPFGATRGEIVMLDAAATLDQLSIAGKPDASLFRQVIGGALRPLCGGGRRVAAYGDMVGLLCERGQYAEAVRLEALWNELLAQVDSALYCGYGSHLFRTPEAVGFGEQIRRAHDEVHEDDTAGAAA